MSISRLLTTKHHPEEGKNYGLLIDAQLGFGLPIRTFKKLLDLEFYFTGLSVGCRLSRGGFDDDHWFPDGDRAPVHFAH